MNSSDTRREDRALRWAARIITLIAAAFWFIYWIPLLLALIAWRWHLLGGLFIVVGSLSAYIRLATIEDPQLGAYLWVTPFFIGGILHMLVGLRDRRHHAVQPG
jgi:hypothetical protein